MKNKVALIVGRFQPFHKGHLFLVKKALEKTDKIIFGIGSSNIHDEYNPLSYEQRREMLGIMIKNERIGNRIGGIVPLDDFYDDKKWLENVRSQIKQADLVIGNSEWVNRILEKAGYKVWRIGYHQKNLYEGWRVRELINLDKDIESRVPKYLVPFIISNIKNPASTAKRGEQKSKINTKYINSILGGTFDHYHKGHKKFIKTALDQSSRVTVGLTTEKFYKDKFLSQSIEDYKKREKNLIDFFKKKKCLDRIKIIPLIDIYGSGNKEEKIDAVFATDETYAGALAINTARREKGWPMLKIVKVPMVKGEDEKNITSERIRTGEIDRAGHVYINRFKRTLTLPENLRQKLRKPIGKILSGDELFRYIDISKSVMAVTVGDIVTNSLVEKGVISDIAIIDKKSRREKVSEHIIMNLFKDNRFQNKFEIEKSSNKSGTINADAVNILYNQIRNFLNTGKKQMLVIDGEEDLLAMPAMLFSPLNTVIFYGQYGLGVVMVQVTEQIKTEVDKIIKTFTYS